MEIDSLIVQVGVFWQHFAFQNDFSLHGFVHESFLD
jgi:hypothetical protein